MSGISILNEQEKTIVFTDLSGVGAEDAPEIMSEAARRISQYPPKSVRSLVDMTNMRFNKAVIAKVTDVAKKNEPFVMVTAIIGLNSVTKLIAKSIIKLTERNTVLFDELEEAKAWLLSGKGEEN